MLARPASRAPRRPACRSAAVAPPCCGARCAWLGPAGWGWVGAPRRGPARRRRPDRRSRRRRSTGSFTGDPARGSSAGRSTRRLALGINAEQPRLRAPRGLEHLADAGLAGGRCRLACDPSGPTNDRRRPSARTRPDGTPSTAYVLRWSASAGRWRPGLAAEDRSDARRAPRGRPPARDRASTPRPCAGIVARRPGVVGEGGFEPPTSCSQSRCATTAPLPVTRCRVRDRASATHVGPPYRHRYTRPPHEEHRRTPRGQQGQAVRRGRRQ